MQRISRALKAATLTGVLALTASIRGPWVRLVSSALSPRARFSAPAVKPGNADGKLLRG
jgi:hypothetical protein